MFTKEQKKNRKLTEKGNENYLSELQVLMAFFSHSECYFQWVDQSKNA